MSDVIENLKKLAEEFRNRLYEVEGKIRILEDAPVAKSLVGKCFKYRNSFGGPKGWWLYRRVVKVSRSTELVVESFQEDAHGKMEFDFDVHGYVHQFRSATQIPVREYLKAQKDFINKLVKRHNNIKKV